jgi:fatty-acyl-CoA synthase
VGGWTSRRAAIAGDRPALLDGERSLDYAALHDRTCRLVGVLREAGIGRGDRVALLLGNRSAYVEGVFAAARCGAIAVPINARFTAPEVARVLADAEPALLLHEQSLADLCVRACQGLATAPQRLACPDAYEEALARTAPCAELAALSPDDPMILMYTSGTTGTPKGALLPHRKTLFNSLNAQLFFGLTSDDRVLVPLPLFHSFGLLILTVPALYSGARVELLPRFDAQQAWQRVAASGITFLGGVPTQLQALLESIPEREARRSLRFLFGAGAAVPVEQIHAFEQQGVVLKQGFGQTETSILTCLDARDALRKAGSVGRPVFHADVRVMVLPEPDAPPESWREAEPGETGEIVVRGPITMLGYWRRPEATAETIRGEWLRTGDLATRDPEGFLYLVGRERDMYISGGENVYPAEVELALAEHPSVREVAVIGVPDERWGEAGRAFVVTQPGGALDPEALATFAAERLARFKLPREYRAIEALPRNETGKVQKQRLPRD